MENFSYSSYPDSGYSSPRSGDPDSENQSWDEPPSSNSNYKVKFMCSYNGKIQPRPHDNQLAYIGGDTKILAVERNVKFATIMTKLSSLCGGGDADVCFKYQLPGEDLDALISVTNDEDLEHMMLEYDRLQRGSVKQARLRLFLFPLNSGNATGFESKSERQWFVDALNSVQISASEGSSPPAAVAKAANPDFLFGLDKTAPTIPEVVVKDGSDCGSEDRVHDRVQIQELQRKIDEANQRVYNENYYGQKVQEKIVPASSVPVQVPVQMPIPTAYMTTAGYPVANEQPVYLIPAPAGMYQAPTPMRPVTGPAGQAYYGMQRVVQDVYREQPVYNAVPQPKVGGYSDGIGMVQQKAEPGFVHMGYDGAGRQVYYTAAPGGMVPQYQAVGVDGRQGGGGGVLNQEGKVVVNPKGPQTSSV